MRLFARISMCCMAVASFVSCGAREDSDSSSLTGRHHPQKPHNNHSDTLPGQVNGRTEGRFPHKPHREMTPGSLCEQASSTRYPEHIRYCERNVEGETKAQIFVSYDREFGYETTKMQRGAFKIDHLIPLCMGGSNEVSNLWPQHTTIYENTDPLEPFLCDLMAGGRIKQTEAVHLILTIKESPFTAPEELRKLEAKY